MKDVVALLKEHPFFSDLKPLHFRLFANCALLRRHHAGDLLVRTGDPADQFFVIRAGKVSIEVATPEGPVIVQTLGDGELVGWSWLFPPYQWSFDVKAVQDTSLIVFDGQCIRAKCESDPALGYDLMKRMSLVLAKRLHSTRLQLLDVYGPVRAQL